MVWCVMKNAGQVLAADQQGEENTRDRNGGRNEKQRTTRVQSPSTLFTSQQNLLTDNWFNPPRPFSGNKLHKHLPSVTRSAEPRENNNIDKNWRGVLTRNDYYGQDRCCNVDIVAYLLVTPHMLASELPSWITTVQSISHYHHNSLTDPDIILPLFQIKLILTLRSISSYNSQGVQRRWGSRWMRERRWWWSQLRDKSAQHREAPWGKWTSDRCTAVQCYAHPLYFVTWLRKKSGFWPVWVGKGEEWIMLSKRILFWTI